MSQATIGVRQLPAGLAFGAALSAMSLMDAPAQGAVVPLTPIPGVQPFQGAASGGSNIQLFNATTGGPGFFYQFNDTLGKSLQGGPAGFAWANIAYGSPITSGLVFGGVGIGTAASGTQTFAFRMPGNELGWVRMNLGGTGGAITYLAAAWNTTPGQGIFAGTLNPVPEPSSLALAGLAALATGAGYVRSRRKAKPAA